MSRLGNILTTLANRSHIMESGSVYVGNVAANSYVDVPITYSKTYPNTPDVVVCLNSNSTSAKMGLVTVATLSRSQTGFTARIFNADTSGRSPYINWIAMV